MDTEMINSVVTTTTSSSQALDLATKRRTSVVFTNTSATAVITLAPGEAAAIAGSGIVLQPTQAYGQSDDSAFSTYQGKWQVVSTSSGTLAVNEQHKVN